jgi:hypothetical protein
MNDYAFLQCGCERLAGASARRTASSNILNPLN